MWAFLRDARDQALIQPGAVVDIVDKSASRVVHLCILPGQLEDYQAVIRRAVIPA
jgi:hypothetical protein